MVDEIFGPVITVSSNLVFDLLLNTYTVFLHKVYVFEDEDFDKTLDLIDSTTEYALTGAM